VNKKINPNVNNIGVSILKFPPHKVASQLNIFTDVGTAIIVVAAVKKARVSTSNPIVYI